ncbi:MAG: hypothetical protein INR71_16120, partial [Terriglobus roseus]|nr:hypothetical protein [Terriglobus roseus]
PKRASASAIQSKLAPSSVPGVSGASASAAQTGSAASRTAAGSSSETTANIIFPGVEPSQLALSVVTAGPSTTVYALGCPTDSAGNAKNDSCPFTEDFHPWLTQAADFWGQNFTQGDVESVTASCRVSGTSSADCTFTFLGLDDGSTTTVNGSPTTIAPRRQTSTDSTRSVFIYGAATVTAGAEKLQATSTGGSDGGSGGSSGSSGSSNAAGPRETGALGLLAAAGIVGAGFVL